VDTAHHPVPNHPRAARKGLPAKIITSSMTPAHRRAGRAQPMTRRLPDNRNRPEQHKTLHPAWPTSPSDIIFPWSQLCIAQWQQREPTGPRRPPGPIPRISDGSWSRCLPAVIGAVDPPSLLQNVRITPAISQGRPRHMQQPRPKGSATKRQPIAGTRGGYKPTPKNGRDQLCQSHSFHQCCCGACSDAYSRGPRKTPNRRKVVALNPETPVILQATVYFGHHAAHLLRA